ncbi:hypothetical protein VTO42DRAFT_2534 [Malbranchea cinnamomea]
MLRICNNDNNNAHPTDGDEATAEADEPPDNHSTIARTSADEHKQQEIYAKSKLVHPEAKKESLLTRALLRGPDPSPGDRSDPVDSFNLHNRVTPIVVHGKSSTSSTGSIFSGEPAISRPLNTIALAKQPQRAESEVEANLGRRRCITFACGRELGNDDQTKTLSDTVKDVKEPLTARRKSALTFVCPTPTRTSASNGNKPADEQIGRKTFVPVHGRRSPAPLFHKRDSELALNCKLYQPSQTSTPKSSKIVVTGLGDFKSSDVTRFHEFGSLSDDEDDWVKETTHDKPKLTMSDCMKKENAIRKLGEEVEEEARQDEEEEDECNEDDDDDEDDEDEDDEDEDEDEDEEDEEDGEDGDGDGDSTVHDGFLDDGNESDNEAGFASDDDSDVNSEFNFWTPGIATAATSVDHAGSVQNSAGRKVSHSSVESLAVKDKNKTPLATREKSNRRSGKQQKFRSGTPELPDSTDFVCGTLDEDRPLEAAYKSCMEERRLSKHVTLPQDIDPSFPTSDPEDEDNDDLRIAALPTARRSRIKERFDAFKLRGRKQSGSSKTSPSHSPKSRLSPPPHRLSGRSPRRLKSPPPPMRRKSPAPPFRHPSMTTHHPAHPVGINITGLGQRGPRIRTKSLPRTPNPFFARLDQLRRPSKALKPSLDRGHTRGPIDIVAGLEQKRQKRKEKFWRQHCRKAAKEQQERRPLPGKGAERMKELGLEVAERFRAYGFGQDTQLVLSI